VGDAKGGSRIALPQLKEELTRATCRSYIKGGECFVEKKQVRLHDEGTSKGYTLALTTT
jgi:hypothetical protein